ncbi:MAG: phasin family protein [Pseudomonadota bacterium]
MATAKKTAKIETFVEDAQKSATEGFDKFSKGVEEMNVFAQENMEAFVKAAEIAAKAAENMNAEVVAFSKKSMQEGAAKAKEMSELKSIPDFVEFQSDLAKSALDDMMSQLTKMNEMTAAAVQDVLAPLNARVEAAADLVKGMRP